MKNNKIVFATLLLFMSASSVFAQSSTISTPYRCSTCGNGISTEPAFVNHLQKIHDIDFQIEGELPDYQPINRKVTEYEPTPYYRDLSSGTSFYSEPQFVNWLDNQ